MTVSRTFKVICWLIGIFALSLFIILVFPNSPFLPSSEDTSRVLLPKESFKLFQKHASSVYESSKELGDDLQLSVQDERVLLHLPKRGFPWLTALFNSGNLYTWAGSTLFMPETKLQSGSREEGIAGSLLSRAFVNRLAANRYACFRLVKELASSPEAMRLEKQAKDLTKKINSKFDAPTESEFLNNLESIRTFFDQLKDLRQMTPDEFARERAESAVLAPAEYLDGVSKTIAPASRKWPDEQLDRQRKWDREGYLLAYSESVEPHDYTRFQMVIKPQGGIFEACQPYDGSHFFPDSFESKLPSSEIHPLQNFLMRMPPSDASGDEVHFIISFFENKSWVTRTYRSLPDGNPFQSLLKRMISQSAGEWTKDPSEKAEFLEQLR